MLSVILMSVFMPSGAVLSVIMLNGIKLIVFMQIDTRLSVVKIRNSKSGKMVKKIGGEKIGGKTIGGKVSHDILLRLRTFEAASKC